MAAIDHAKRHDLCDHVGENLLSNGQTVAKLEQNEARVCETLRSQQHLFFFVLLFFLVSVILLVLVN